jgi:hypothetical protein
MSVRITGRALLKNSFAGWQMRPSRELVVALRLSKRPQYSIALKAGVHPNTLSKLINGIEKVRPYDKRLVAVGKILKIPPKRCFEISTEPDQKSKDAS